MASSAKARGKAVIYDLELDSAAHLPAEVFPELAELAEERGFNAVWLAEANSLDPLVVLSGLATRTRSIRLGVAVYHIYGRSPVTMGVQAATLQDLSGGRLLLGLGVSNRTIAAWHGGTFDRPVRRAREYMDVVRRVAAGERVEYDGKLYSTGKRFQLAWRPRHPDLRLYLAGLGPQMASLAGRTTEGVFVNMATPSKVREIAARARAGAEAAGRDPDQVEVVVKVRASLHPERPVARSRLRQVLAFYTLADHYSDMLGALGFGREVDAVRSGFESGRFRGAVDALSDDYMDRLPVVPATSMQELRRRLLPFAESGATRLVVPYVPAGDAPVQNTRDFLRAWEGS